jgi:hypothetical protein
VIAIESLTVKLDSNVSDPTIDGNVKTRPHHISHSQRGLLFGRKPVGCAAVGHPGRSPPTSVQSLPLTRYQAAWHSMVILRRRPDHSVWPNSQRVTFRGAQ